jgi:hypothetical protein
MAGRIKPGTQPHSIRRFARPGLAGAVAVRVDGHTCETAHRP